MDVRTILAGKVSAGVIAIEPERTIQQAIERLVEHNIGALVVVDAAGEPVGIITERDILRACTHGADRLESTRVEEVMSADLIVGELDDTVDYVMGIMTTNRIRHLPIVGERGLSGMVSIGDVVKVQLQEADYENRHLKEYIRGSY
ncbi:MAG TPA: CBS domain-containing protein [Gemmatimonadota bacterium]|nr:CBS domain-containing protein [Gemmatimonadota bacterium]